jgi:hypothetical protein
VPHIVSSPDFISIVTNVGVFLAALGTVVAAIWGAVKKIKTLTPDAASPVAQSVIGGSIMENSTLLLWSDSNRGVIDALRDHQKEMMELRFAVLQLRDTLK